MRKTLPEKGLGWDRIEPMLDQKAKGDIDWRRGRAPLYVFFADEETYEVGRRAYFKFFAENALGGKRAFFSVKEMEDDLIEIGLSLFKAPDEARGALSTGGSESIFLAVQACRKAFRAAGKAARLPAGRAVNMVVAESAHPAFNKAADAMDIEVRRVVLGADFRADVGAMAAACDEGTLMLVGSAPCFPHGVIDDIAGLSRVALERDIWLHVDACVGGYLAPFVAEAGYDLPAFDFALPGVRSISADLHKFGFCPKPASSVFYRRAEDYERSVFNFDDWPNGRFVTATLTGTRPGGAIAAAWAVFHHLGREGYCDIARRLRTMTQGYLEGIRAIEGLEVWGEPDLTIINFGSSSLDIFAVAERLAEAGWLPGLTQRPKGLHAMLSLLHEPAREDYLADLRRAVEQTGGSGATSSLKASY